MRKKLLSLFIIFGMILNTSAVSVFAVTPNELYDQVWKLITKKYVDQTNNSQDWYRWRYRYKDKLNTKEDAYVAIDTMLSSLNDPYTRFLDPKEFQEETSSIKGSLKGIGFDRPVL